ncbi:non-hydrolyzing UDP-N-acetylglucosamine 2-epimerase [Halobellus rarus]|uniref:Non-hydrolyzing UDP-N-acetylglucosamine 2-epimerase n=1 Tax=Halobellus rarus TaxID=1126237 RepID=A0ABD6CRN6_9EURY|nr:UDP-N-acetylglucosamine 2-epimerase (non-hydrolyzing) [Halobellus rarus]
MTDVAFVLGTRPEIIKLAPVVQACQRFEVDYTIIHTGQHYSDSLDSVFFDQLELPEPDYNLGVGSSSHGEQTGEMLIGIERALTETAPDVVLVQGDTNSVLAGAIAASKMDAELGHVEAGLRSFDRSMPEETNRVVSDHVSEYLFAPTEQSKTYLLDEGLSEHRITVTGNTVVDALLRNREIARQKSNVIADLGLEGTEFFVMTAHRQENVDDEARFRELLAGVERAAEAHDAEVIYPVHPRARDRLEAFGLDVPDRIRTIEPLEYLDFLRLSSMADLILTDSGGVQEEACILGVPCVTMRDNTERPETIDVGANRLSSCDPGQIVASATEMLLKGNDWENPFGDGDAAERILRALPLEIKSREVAQ